MFLQLKNFASQSFLGLIYSKARDTLATSSIMFVTLILSELLAYIYANVC